MIVDQRCYIHLRWSCWTGSWTSGRTRHLDQMTLREEERWGLFNIWWKLEQPPPKELRRAGNFTTFRDISGIPLFIPNKYLPSPFILHLFFSLIKLIFLKCNICNILVLKTIHFSFFPLDDVFQIATWSHLSWISLNKISFAFQLETNWVQDNFDNTNLFSNFLIRNACH